MPASDETLQAPFLDTWSFVADDPTPTPPRVAAPAEREVAVESAPIDHSVVRGQGRLAVPETLPRYGMVWDFAGRNAIQIECTWRSHDG